MNTEMPLLLRPEPGSEPATPGPLLAAHPRVLVVEDEMTVAALIEDMVNAMDCEVTAMVGRLEDAMRLADSGSFDLAILDVYLNGKTVFPFAAELDRLEIPYLFATAYGVREIPPAFRGHPMVQKPFGPAELRRALMTLGAGF